MTFKLLLSVLVLLPVTRGHHKFYEAANQNLDHVPTDIPQCTSRVALPYNKITTLPADVFEGMENLTYLYMAGNGMKLVETHAFRGTGIQELLLFDNELTTVPYLGDIKTSLTVLNLAENHLEWIHSDTYVGTIITELNLNNNRFTYLPHLRHIKDTLMKLHLSGNVMDRDIGREAFKGFKIRELYLYGTGLTSVPYLGELRYSLETLDVGGNSLNHLPPDTFRGMHIRVLELVSCNLTSMPSLQSISSSIQEVRLDRNHLRDIPRNAFRGSWLRMLYVASNKLSRIPSLWDIRLTLEELDLSGNEIVTVHGADFEGIQKLSRLNLRENPLTSLPDLSLLVPSLQVLDIMETGLDCCDRIYWLKNLAHFYTSEDYCVEPAQLLGTAIVRVTEDDLQQYCPEQ